MNPRYLTKSRFKIGLECPTKLFYTKKEEYFDGKLEDEFLQALAAGGFQVGELAKLYYPGGTNIDELDYEISLAKTAELLKKQDVIIYEAAFLYRNLFIRADLLIKKGNAVDLIEVKAKSFDPHEESFLTKQGFIIPEWEPYLYDAAFQKFVIGQAYPSFHLSTFLLLADKSKAASVNGLNQKFLIYQTEGRKQVKVNGPVDKDSLGEKILTLQNIDAILEKIYDGTEKKDKSMESFEDRVFILAENYSKDSKIMHPLSSKCGSCEFRIELEKPSAGLKSGFHECWREKASFTDADFQRPSVLEVWNFQKKTEYIQQGIYFQDQLTRAMLEPKNRKEKTGPGLSRWERQVLQIEMSAAVNQPTVGGPLVHYIDISGLEVLKSGWKYPYHFIDFETMAVAIPFTKGRKPYEMVAFQFSHHRLSEDGTLEHKGQWISAVPGVFPNFDFVRSLREELNQDEGTIFRYADHENTVLNAIYHQLLASDEKDKNALCDWIRQITHKKEEWTGPRDMVDLKKLIEKFCYNPMTRGSISIKQVLPAILSSCDYLKEKYAKPIYGTETIRSLNFKEQQWVQFSAQGELINPYQLLPRVNEEIENSLLDASFTDEATGIQDGGAALSAYAKMQ